MKRLTSSLFAVAMVLVAVSNAQALPVPLALSSGNVADEGTAILVAGALITPVANANDTQFTGDILNNLMTITGTPLTVEIDLVGAHHLGQLGAYVDPNDSITDPFKNTSSVEFLISTNNGGSFSSVGFGAFTPGALGNFSFVSLTGSFAGVTNVRYVMNQAQGGAEGQRVAELVAIAVPEPATGLLALLGLPLMFRRRRAA